jgi:hypothetical protein
MTVIRENVRDVDTAKRLNLLWEHLRLGALVPKATAVAVPEGKDAAWVRVGAGIVSGG